MFRVFTDRRCLGHSAPPGYPEKPRRLEAVLESVRAAGLDVVDQGQHPGAELAIESIHGGQYVDRFRRACERGDGLLDSADNPLSPGTWQAARGAVSAALHAADWMLAAPSRAAFAAVRPPGHHAEAGAAMGFCFFNNVAVAADHLLRMGIERIAVLDFDVHHGNGTQHIFEQRQDVLYVSTHQHPFYPGTGAATETGRGAGEGFTLNLPMPAGSTDADFEGVLLDRAIPALRAFRPDALLVSAGFDAWQNDPLGGMRVTEDGFRQWGAWLAQFASETCQGRFLEVLEGGYDLENLGGLVQCHAAGVLDGFSAASG
ncbi:MAG: histone deacetylase [Acidobacteriota bacterium]